MNKEYVRDMEINNKYYMVHTTLGILIKKTISGHSGTGYQEPYYRLIFEIIEQNKFGYKEMTPNYIYIGKLNTLYRVGKQIQVVKNWDDTYVSKTNE